jgi:hypothetical protein
MNRIETNEICCKKIKHSAREMGIIGHSKCNNKAEWTNGTHFFCTKHSKMQRWVVRDGDVGKILARFDTEQELRNNIHLYPGMRGQKLSKSHRRDII